MTNPIRNGYLIIIFIIFTYLCTVLSSYHVINYLALLLGLTLITSIYRTFDPLIKTKLKVKPNRVAAKINRDIVVYNKVSSFANIEKILNYSDLVNDTVKLSSSQYQPSLDIKFKKKVNLFELNRLSLVESRLSLIRWVSSNTRVLDIYAFFSSFDVSTVFLKKEYRYEVSSDGLLNRAWILKSIVIGTAGAEKIKIESAIKYYLQKRDLLVKIETLLINNKKNDLKSLIYELSLVESACDFESLELKYFQKWNSLLNKKGIYKCLYFIASYKANEITHNKG